MADNHKGRVLIVDDEPNAVKVLSMILQKDGYNIFESQNVDNAIKTINENDIDAIISDVMMPEKSGMYLFEYISKNNPAIPLIFLTAFGNIDAAIHAVTSGAFYYFTKPPDYDKFKNILLKAVEQRRLKREIETLRKRDLEKTNLPHLIGNHPSMLKILKNIEAIKDSASNVLIFGETGTGKELIAKMLHYTGNRKEKPFIAVNCAAIPKDLIESELFGYEKGAFTGAVSKRIGKFEDASDGTVFLDEIGELEISLQAKLLRVLQEREIERLGSNKKVAVNFRLLSSTNRDLKKEIGAGAFREDLFYRINVVHIEPPPLRERKTDIPLFIAEFVKEFCLRDKKVLTISDDVVKIFQSCNWPGNIRQLRNFIERAVVLAKGNMITTEELPQELMSLKKQIQSAAPIKTLKQLELEAIRDAIERCDGNKSKAASLLGISRKAFYKRLKDL